MTDIDRYSYDVVVIGAGGSGLRIRLWAQVLLAAGNPETDAAPVWRSVSS